MAVSDICPRLDKDTCKKKKKVSERFKGVSEVPQAMRQCCGVDVRNWKAFLISFDLGSVAHGTCRSFDRVMIVCERQISNLSQFDERHACKQVYHSSLDMPCNFNVVYGISRCQRA